MTHEPNTEHVLALAAIIRQVDIFNCTSAKALARLILAHPESQWGPTAPWPQLPREAPPEVLNLATFGACNQEDAAKFAWQCANAEIDRQRIGQGLSVPEPAPWPQLPPQPPGSPSRGENPYWTDGFVTAWALARVELQRLREQAGVAPAAPTFPRISDSLMRSLIGDVLDESETATKAACMDRPYNPVPRIRARLTEILRLAAQDEAAKRPAS